MFFKRVYRLTRVTTVADLADQLTKLNWRLCNAFRLDGHDDTLFLNDSTSPAGIQEYAVLRQIEGAWYQVESITCGWITSQPPARGGAHRNIDLRRL